VIKEGKQLMIKKPVCTMLNEVNNTTVVNKTSLGHFLNGNMPRYTPDAAFL